MHNTSSLTADTEPDGGVSGVGMLTTYKQEAQSSIEETHSGIEWSSNTSARSTKAAAVSWNALDNMRGNVCSPSAVHSSASEQSCGLWNSLWLHWILTFINHTCLWVNSQLRRFNKRCAGRPRQSMCLIYTGVREIIMEILRGRWTLITAQNKSRGDMKIDRRFSPSRLSGRVWNWNNTKLQNISSNIASWGRFWLWRLENYVPLLWVIVSHYSRATVAINSLW